MCRPLLRSLAAGVVSLLWLTACGGGEGGDAKGDGGDRLADGFSIEVSNTDDATVVRLIEGAAVPLLLPVALVRADGHERPVSLSVAGAAAGDLDNLSADFVDASLQGNERATGLRLSLGVAAQPIAMSTRRLSITATDGVRSEQVSIDVQVQPTDAPDVYLLIGQSNMVGFSGDDTREAGPGGLDATDTRIRQLNVTENDSDVRFKQPADYVSADNNTGQPTLTLAEDPLHVMPDEGSGKDEQYIGLGLSFAKRALVDTSARVVLVPAAWSGSSFCANDNGPQGNWNVGSSEPALGNDLLFQRALLRTDLALQASGGILRGILWHQGESDANPPCAALYADNLDRLAAALRTQIRVDARGAQARGPKADIPFVVGTLSRGDDPRGDFSVFNDAKEQIDQVIRATPDRLAWSALSLHDDLTPANGFPCGAGDCIHFGAEALREMGVRYYNALREATTNRPL